LQIVYILGNKTYLLHVAECFFRN